MQRVKEVLHFIAAFRQPRFVDVELYLHSPRAKTPTWKARIRQTRAELSISEPSLAQAKRGVAALYLQQVSDWTPIDPSQSEAAPSPSLSRMTAPIEVSRRPEPKLPGSHATPEKDGQ